MATVDDTKDVSGEGRVDKAITASAYHVGRFLSSVASLTNRAGQRLQRRRRLEEARRMMNWELTPARSEAIEESISELQTRARHEA
jgi:hypothetical protein